MSTRETPSSDRDLVMRFESLGGTGHGWEFAHFQARCGDKPDGLLCWSDLGDELLMQALERRFDGVGARENTIVFHPDGSDEWWTKDSRYWMVQRSFVKAADMTQERMVEESERKLTSRRDKLIADLGRGDKIFVYKNMFRNLTPGEVARLHAAVRSYGDSTLFYIRRADKSHSAIGVTTPAPGLLIGTIDHFEYSPENEYLGSPDARFLELCRRAWALHAGSTFKDEAASPPAAAISRPVVQPGRSGRRARRIVLIGNSQMQVMAEMYQRFVAGRTGDIVHHIKSVNDLAAEDRDVIAQADVLVEQRLDSQPRAEIDGLSRSVPRLSVPFVTAGFLWPFAGQPHPRNTGTPFLTDGPYGAESCDSYLNKLILAGTPPDEAVEAYLNLDVDQEVNLDRLFEHAIDRQRSRDKASGYEMADVIVRHFRTEQVFLSPNHPNRRIAVALATRLFEQLGAHRDDIDRMQQRTRVTSFPKTELPLHPAVCRHWGMDFAGPDRRYRFMDEGYFTFREYAGRYMRYEWNGALEEGMYLTFTGNYQPAIERLAAGLERSAASAPGYDALGYALEQLGWNDDALAATRRAVELAPGNATYRANLGNMLRERGSPAEAAAELRQAINDDPTEPHFLMLLAHVLRERADLPGAAEQARNAIALDPWTVSYRMDLADFLEEAGDWDGAVDVLQAATAVDPGHEQAQDRLAMAQDNQALAAVAAVENDAGSLKSRLALSDCLLRLGRTDEALTHALIAAVANPDSAVAYAHLGHALREAGEPEGAEEADKRAAALEPATA